MQSVTGSFGAAGKAITVLDTVAVSREPLSLSEIGRRTGLSKATVHRVLSALTSHGMLVRGPGGGYQLGHRPHRWSYPVTALVEPQVVPPLIELHRRAGLAIALTVLSGDMAVPLFRLHDRHQARDIAPLMSHMPLHCTASGKVLLAFDLAAADHFLARRALHPYTTRTVTSVEEFAEVLAQTRAEGLGRTVGEFQSRVSALAVPVTDSSRRTIAAVAVAGPHARVGSPHVARLLRASAAELAGSLRPQQRSIVRNIASTGPLTVA